MAVHPSFSLPSRLGSLCSDKLLMNFVRPSNLTDIMEYGFQDLGDHFHTDIVLFPKSGDPVSIHSILLCTASPLLSSILSTISTPQLQQTILLPEADSLTLTAMCQLLYGSAVLLSGDEISRLNHLLDTLNITMNISVLNSVHITGLRTSSSLPSELQSLNPPPELQSLDPNPDLQSLNSNSDLQPLNPPPELHSFITSSQDDPQQSLLQVQVTRRRKQILENSGTSRGSQSYQIGDTDCSLTIPADIQLNQTKQMEGILENRSLSINPQNESENAPVSSNPPEVFILPDSQLLEPESVQNISYGEDVVDERNPVQNSVSLTRVPPAESQGLDGSQAAKSQTLVGALAAESRSSGGALAADSRSLVGALVAESRGSGGAKGLDPVLEQLEETVQTSGYGLPLLCWHCSEEFTTFKLLSEHVEQLTHTKHLRKHHRCPRCGDVLTSMWKLRQHLAQHQTSQFVGKGDHPYAEKKTKRIQAKKHCTRSGDHGYATATQLNTKLVPKPVLIPELSKRGSRRVQKKVPNAGNDEELRRGDSKWRNGRVLKRLREVEEGGEGVRKEGTEGETKGMTVSKEHSYGTQRDSSPDHDQMDVEERIDHPYSVISTINQSINSSHQQLFSDYVPREECNKNVINSENKNESQRAGLLENRSIVENSEGERLINNRKAGLLENRSIVENRSFMENSIRQEQVEAGFINNSSPRGRTRSGRGVTKDEVNLQIFNCEICRKSFPANYRLVRHVREVHIKEKTHKCDECSREFFKTANLFRHIVSVHHGVRPYACSHCFVGFKDTTALKYHTENAVCQKHKNTALPEDMVQSWI